MGVVIDCYKRWMVAINNSHLPSLVLSAWMMALLTWVTHQVFSDISLITGTVATALGIVFGLPAIILTLIQWRHGGHREEDT